MSKLQLVGTFQENETSISYATNTSNIDIKLLSVVCSFQMTKKIN